MDNDLLLAIGALLDQKLDQKLAPINDRLDGIDASITGIKEDITGINGRLETLEDNMCELMDDMKFVKETAIKIELGQGQRVSALEDGQVVLESRLDDHDAQLRKLAQ